MQKKTKVLLAGLLGILAGAGVHVALTVRQYHMYLYRLALPLHMRLAVVLVLWGCILLAGIAAYLLWSRQSK